MFAVAGVEFAAVSVFFARVLETNARIHVLVVASRRALFIVQIRWLWREQWPFKVSKRISRRMRDIFGYQAQSLESRIK